ncbi:MAG: apolipoprotein N-acyltransferase [bacterium]|nr:MAG: apolipoprotein N-acyltransferase [bacterium]
MHAFLKRYREEILSGLAGGLLLALAFPPFPLRFLVIVALVPLFRYFIVRSERAETHGTAGAGDGATDTGNRAKREACGRDGWRPYLKGSFILGYAFGVAFFLTLLYWTANLIPESSARIPWLLIPALVLLVLYLACYTGLFTMALAVMVRRFGRAGLLAGPGLWVVVELARSTGELAFPWGMLPYALAIHPVALQGLSFYGPFGLSVVLALVNLLLAVAFFSRFKGRRISAFVVAVAVAAGHLVWGVAEIARCDQRVAGESSTENVVVVQANVDLAIKWLPAYRDSIFNEIEKLTDEAAGMGAEVVLFPETAAPISLSLSPRSRDRLRRIAGEAGVDLLIGYIDHKYSFDHWVAYNSAGLFDHTGQQTGHYNKVNLLPFGERIPWSQYLPFLSKLDFGQANFEPGTERTRFQTRAGTFGVLICYESIFSGYTRRYVLEGADFLVNITNDGWFGSRVGPLQHAEMAILRAVENRVTLLRSANTGISMVVDPAGRVRQRIGLDLPGMIQSSIMRSRGLTFYCRHGHLIFFVLVAVCIAVGPLLSVVRRRPLYNRH